MCSNEVVRGILVWILVVIIHPTLSENFYTIERNTHRVKSGIRVG